MKLEKRLHLLKVVKAQYLRVCIGILMLFSVFMFFSGLRFDTTNWSMAWWAALLYGWSGLVVAVKLSNFLDKGE